MPLHRCFPFASGCLALFTAVSLSHAQPGPADATGAYELTAKAYVEEDRREVPQGEDFVLVIELDCLFVKDRPWAPVDTDINLKLAPSLEMQHSETRTRVEERPEGVTKKHFLRYTLRGTETGPARVEPVTVRYRIAGVTEEQEIRTGPVSLEIVAPAGAGGPSWTLILAVACGVPLVVLGLAGAGYFLFRGRKPGADSPAEPPEAPWLRRIEEAGHKRIQGEPRETIHSLLRTLVLLLAMRYRLPGTTGAGEVRRRLEDDPDEWLRERAGGLLDRCEQARYAPEVPPDPELDRLQQEARDIVHHAFRRS